VDDYVRSALCGRPPSERRALLAPPGESVRLVAVQDAIDAILRGTSPSVPAVEGIFSVELANAMLYSTLARKTVDLPLDAGAFERRLQGLARRAQRSAGPSWSESPVRLEPRERGTG
jgi:hypothetical protein